MRIFQCVKKKGSILHKTPLCVKCLQSIDGYDYQPSTAYFKLLEDSPWFQSCLSTNAGYVFLLRHAPLSNLYNSIAEVLNSFQECSISTAVPGLVNLIRGLMIFCIHKVASVKLGKRSDSQNEIDMVEQQLLQRSAECGSPISTQAEFFVFSDIFAWVLVPTISKHLSAIVMADVAAFSEVFFVTALLLLDALKSSARVLKVVRELWVIVCFVC